MFAPAYVGPIMYYSNASLNNWKLLMGFARLVRPTYAGARSTRPGSLQLQVGSAHASPS
jgi:hypothetical protein